MPEKYRGYALEYDVSKYYSYIRLHSFPIKTNQKKVQKMFNVKIDSTCFTFIDQKRTEYGNYQVCVKKFQTFC